MTYERSLYPKLSWSHSRRRTFQECPRKYFYHYYESNASREPDASETSVLAYRLKNLTSLALEVGAALHEAASTAIDQARSGVPVPTVEELYAQARKRLNKAWADSKDRQSWWRSPKWRRMFHEFYYDTGIGEDRIASAKEQLMACLANFLDSVSYREALASPRVEIRNVEEFVTFDIDGTDIHAVPDLIYRRGDNVWVVVDWKSGKRQDDNAEQALVYALFVRQRYEVSASDVRVRVEQLATGDFDDYQFTDDDLDGCVETIRDSIAAMKTYLIDAGLNTPVARDGFPLRTDTSVCRFLQLLRVVHRRDCVHACGPVLGMA